ncbi:MAG: hypothetical protein AABX80_00730, partial [Nanoarchaeota archaeon]
LVKEQNKYSPETKKLFDEEAKIADEFLREKGINPGKSYKYKIVGTAEIGPNGEIIKKDSQHQEREITDEEKIILYHAYNKIKEENPYGAGIVLEGIETANELEKKGAKNFWEEKVKESEKENKPEYIGPNKYNSENKFHQGAIVANNELRKLVPEQIIEFDKAFDKYDPKKTGENLEKWMNQQKQEEKEVDFLFAKPIGDNTYYYFKLAGKDNLYKNYNESSKLANYIVIKNSPYGNQIIDIAKDFKKEVEKVANWWDK